MCFGIFAVDTESFVSFAVDISMATADIKELIATVGGKFRIINLPDSPDEEEWQKRESDRLVTGHYTKVIWYDEAWYQDSVLSRLHFVHTSKVCGEKIAYTASPRDGREDKQKRTTVAQYLNKFFGNVLSKNQIDYYVAQHGAKYGDGIVKFARTPDEIERVYSKMNGPASCMSEDADFYHTGGIHPVRCYGDSDLSVAYLEVGGRCINRALVWEARKLFGRTYGVDRRPGVDYWDSGSLIRDKLFELGYKRPNGASSLKGARINVLYTRKGDIICPYIDGNGGDHVVDVDGDEMIINVGTYNAESIYGLLGDERAVCADCGERIDEGEGCTVDGSIYCESCYCDNFASCERCGESHRHDDMRTVNVRNRHGVVESEYWCESCTDNRATQCEDCGEYFAARDRYGRYEGDCTEVQRDGDTVHLCEDCRDKLATECPDCGEWYDDGDVVDVVGEDGNKVRVCKDCRDEEYTKCGICGEYHHNDNVDVIRGGIMDSFAVCKSCVESATLDIGDGVTGD